MDEDKPLKKFEIYNSHNVVIIILLQRQILAFPLTHIGENYNTQGSGRAIQEIKLSG